ncbi:MATE family efflux transporter [bacterium 1xD8-48]|jgi:putative MATE family efflux protein|nr:MATE family efflux transporter [Lachnospiraceae bacterium]MCI9326042.1 MATE family efflux transporter [Lachnospiraceae bacterium]NBJ96017.1 MATE family efflux transporter [bacterium 1xD8-48]
MRAKQVDFSKGSVTQNIIRVAAPMLVAQILNLMYNIVDRIYIGRIPGEGLLALGGVGLCFPFISLITAFTNLYGAGGAPLCSIERGRGNQEEAGEIMNTSFYLLVITGVILTILGSIFCRPILILFGASGASLPYAMPYMRIYLMGTVFAMVALGMNPFINSQGFANVGMTTIFLGAVTNIVLDPIFIFVFHLGVRGAALATICSQILSAVFVVRFLTGKRAELRISLKRKPSFGKRRVLDIVGLGSASFVMQCTNSLVQIACNRMLGAFGGDVYISTMTIINSVRQILDTPVLAIADGASPILSYNYGAKRYDNVKKAIRFITLSALVYTGATWVLILLFPEMFIGIFNNDDSLLTVAVPALHIYFFAFIFQALQYSGQTVFKSLNKKKQAIFFSLLRKVVIVAPLTFFLPYVGNLGANGVFVAEPVSNFLGGSACFLAMILTVMPELGGRRKEQRERTD